MYELRQILTAADTAEAEALLQTQGLLLPDEVEYGVGAYRDDSLVATGFLGKGRLMGLCVAPHMRGEGLSLTVVDHLLKEALATGCEHLFIFTKGSEARTFAEMGFELLAVAPCATGETALLEWGRPNLQAWLAGIPRPILPASGLRGPLPRFAMGAVVLNANPFTLGHRYLLEQAAAQCGTLYAFVVEEDRSIFPFDTRIALVREGMARQKNCLVLPGGPYMISRHTFPSYFTGKEGQATAHAALDAQLFAACIAPALHITARFVGTEPYSAVTAAYNSALHTVLPRYGIALCELDRLEQEKSAVSASRVRASLARGDMTQAQSLVPESTTKFLLSSEGRAIVRSLQQTKDTICPQSKE